MGILYRTPAPVVPGDIGDPTIPVPRVPPPPEFEGKTPKPGGSSSLGPYGPGYTYVCYCIELIPRVPQAVSGLKIIKRCYCGWQKI